MIRLFPADAEDFTSLGLGALRDTISCTITEERNGAYEMELTYPISGSLFSAIGLRSLIVAPPNPYDSPQAFRVYKITKPLNGIVTIYAQHISYDMHDIPVAPFAAVSLPDALEKMTQYALTTCQFILDTDRTTETPYSVTEPRSLRSALGGEAGSILSRYHGEWEFDNLTAFLHMHRGEDRGVRILYGKNLTSLEQEESIANTYTGICPYWKNGETGEIVRLPEGVINAPGTFGFSKIDILDLSDKFETAPTVAELRAAAEDYIDAHNFGVPDVNLKISFQDLAQTEEYKDLIDLEIVKICDTVTVEFVRLGVSATAEIYKTTFDALLGRYISIELGSIKQTLADTIIEGVNGAAQAEAIASNIYTAGTTTIDGGRITTETITAAQLATDAIKSRNYDGDGNDFARAGSIHDLANGIYASTGVYLSDDENKFKGAIYATSGSFTGVVNGTNGIYDTAEIGDAQITGRLAVSEGEAAQIPELRVKRITGYNGEAAPQTISATISGTFGSLYLTADVHFASAPPAGYTADVTAYIRYKASGVWSWRSATQTFTGNGTDTWLTFRWRNIDGATEVQASFEMVTPTVTSKSFTFIAPPSYLESNTIIPSNGTSDLGSASAHWREIYADNVVNTSARRVKRDIEDLDNRYLDLLMSLRPRRFRFKYGDRIHTGLILDELRDAIDAAGLDTDELAAYCLSDKSVPDGLGGIRYTELIAILIAAVQRLNQKISILEENKK